MLSTLILCLQLSSAQPQTAPDSFPNLNLEQTIDTMYVMIYDVRLSGSEAQEWADFAWAKMSDADRLDPEYMKLMRDFYSQYRGMNYGLANPVLKYTLAHQKDYEKAWGHSNTYLYQRQLLQTELERFETLFKNTPPTAENERQALVQQVVREVNIHAPQHRDYMQCYLNFAAVYDMNLNPESYWSAADIYIRNYEENPLILLALSRATLRYQIPPKHYYAALDWLAKIKEDTYKKLVDLLKLQLYVKLNLEEEAKQLADIYLQSPDTAPYEVEQIKHWLTAFKNKK